MSLPAASIIHPVPAFEYGRASLYQADALAWLRDREANSIHGW